MNMRLSAVFCLIAWASSSGAVILVNGSASGSGDGSTWANAHTTITAALSHASAGDQIWVAAGTYNGPITLAEGVEIYGGFSGTEQMLAQMDPDQNATVITGGGTQRALTSIDTTAATVLRGVTIRDGVLATIEQAGGGLYLRGSSAVFVQCRFVSNSATFAGGAVAIYGGGAPTFVNCEFLSNGLAAGIEPVGGGAVFNHDGQPRFENCVFAGNRAGDGGAVVSLAGTIEFVNCTFYQNEATKRRGGAIFDNRGEALVRNCILWANISPNVSSRAIYNHARASRQTEVANSDVEGGWAGTTNIDADPLFVDAVGKDFRLQADSPCRDRGRSQFLPSELVDLNWDGILSSNLPTDLGRGQRVEGTAVDMGAFERRP